MKTPTFRSRNTKRARELRNQATPAERILWRHISKSQIAGYKFTRQFQIGPYFGDFVCRGARLVIELDGFSHDARQKYDANRTSFLQNEGYAVLRFGNDDIFENIEGVLVMIEQALIDRPTPSPSRKREGDS